MDGEIIYAVFPGVAALPCQHLLSAGGKHLFATGGKQLHRATPVGVEREAVAHVRVEFEPVDGIVVWDRDDLGGVAFQCVGKYGAVDALVDKVFRAGHKAGHAIPEAEVYLVAGIDHGAAAVWVELERGGAERHRVYIQQLYQSQGVHGCRQCYPLQGCLVVVVPVIVACHAIAAQRYLVEERAEQSQRAARFRHEEMAQRVQAVADGAHIEFEVYQLPAAGDADRGIGGAVDAVVPPQRGAVRHAKLRGHLHKQVAAQPCRIAVTQLDIERVEAVGEGGGL